MFNPIENVHVPFHFAVGRSRIGHRLAATALGLLVTAVLAATSAEAQCVPADSSNTTITIVPMPRPCQYVFNPDGSADRIEASIVLRDGAGNPIDGALVAMELIDETGTINECLNSPSAIGMTNAAGEVQISLGEICGCGSFRVQFASVCPGDVTTLRAAGIRGPFDGTSPDLNGSCSSEPVPVNVIDLGLFGGCLSSYSQCCDYNCSGDINVVDLGVWAGGLGTGCP